MFAESMKKKDRAAELIQQNETLFRCPACAKAMHLQGSNRLVCMSGHSFDLSRKGYLNLLQSGVTPVYTKELFEARHRVCEAGFFSPLICRLAEIADNYIAGRGGEGIRILDAGCGEGSHLHGLSRMLSGQGDNIYTGADISKDSIYIGSTYHDGIIWCVADLAKLPFQDSSFDVILNILSPANYGEFERILLDEGMVIKVIPGSEYLIELREIVQQEGKGRKYSNKRVADYFEEKLTLKEIQNLRYTFPVSEDMLPHFMKMTPLTWGKEGIKTREDYGQKVTSITAEMTILVGQKKV